MNSILISYCKGNQIIHQSLGLKAEFGQGAIHAAKLLDSVKKYLTSKHGRVSYVSVAPGNGKAFRFTGWVHPSSGSDWIVEAGVVAVDEVEARVKVRKFLRGSVVADDFKLEAVTL